MKIIQVKFDYPPRLGLSAPEFAPGVNLRRHATLLDPKCDVCDLEFAAGVNLDDMIL